MPLYRRKPILINAFQFTPTNKIPIWFAEKVDNGEVYFQGGDQPYYTIETLDGKMKANIGDYIIKDQNGRIYPCKPNIFDEIYEAV